MVPRFEPIEIVDVIFLTRILICFSFKIQSSKKKTFYCEFYGLVICLFILTIMILFLTTKSFQVHGFKFEIHFQVPL